MSYRLTTYLQLGASQSGTTPSALLINTDGTTYGSPVYSGFSNLGGGQFLWDYSAYPNDFRGGVKIYPSGTTTGTPIAGFAINPQEAEYLDSKISDIPSGVNVTLSAQHGSGGWGESGAGDNVLTVTTYDDSGNILGGTKLQVRPSGSSTIDSLLYSNSSTGRAAFNLDAGVYDIYATKSHYAYFTNPTRVTVSADASLAISGVVYSIQAPTEPNLTRLYAFVTDFGIEPQEGIKLIVSLSNAPSGPSGYILKSYKATSETDTDGYVYIDVPSSVGVNARIPDADFDKTFTSPASGLYNLASLI